MTTEEEFSCAIPTAEGRYAFYSEELENEIEELEIIKSEKGLIVMCPYLGQTHLDHFHNGLTGPKWKKL